MTHFKRMAFVLALIIGLCGGAWTQGWEHNENDKSRDDHTLQNRDRDRDRDPGRDRDHDRRDPNYQYRNEGRGNAPTRTWGGNYPNIGWGYVGNASNSAYQSGYNDGLRIGRSDARSNRAYQPGNYKAYKQGNQAYRTGFAAGYREGYGRGW